VNILANDLNTRVPDSDVPKSERDAREQEKLKRMQNGPEKIDGFALFAILIKLFFGFKNGTNDDLEKDEGIKTLASAFGLDQKKFAHTVSDVRDGKQSVYQAAASTYAAIDTSKADLSKVQAAAAKYLKSDNPLLELIGDKESGGDYNRAYSKKGIVRVDFTHMTINEVRKWQDDYVKNGSPSSAVGKFQIIRGTMDDLIKKMGLTGNELFDEKMQDRMAIQLLKDKGYDRYLAGDPKLPDSVFLKRVSQVWASMPKDESGLSFYHGDKLNHAGTSHSVLLATMQATRDKLSGSSDGSTILAQADTPQRLRLPFKPEGTDQTGKPPTSAGEAFTLAGITGGTNEILKASATRPLFNLQDASPPASKPT